MKHILCIDVGGTNIKIGVFTFEKKLIKKYMIPTIIEKGENKKFVINQLITLIKDEMNFYDLESVGIGMPGPVNNGVLLGAHNLNLNKINLLNNLKEEFPNLKIKIINDANAACLGEAKRGSGISYNNIVLLTIGTGIGCGIFLNNNIVEGSWGSAGEAGHMCVEVNGKLCGCGKSGCLEKYASCDAIISTASDIYSKYNISVNDLSCEQIFSEYEKGFAPAIETVKKTIYYLAMGIGNIINVINPDAVIIGGGLSNAGEMLLNPVKYYLHEFTFYTVKKTPILIAKLKNDAAIYGLSELNYD